MPLCKSELESASRRNEVRRLLLAAIASGLVAVAFGTTATAGGSGGVTGPSFYVDGQLYRTVGTPTDLSTTGAPDHSFDTIYEFFGLQPNVATAAPGDSGYNGGRWRVHGLQFTNYAAAVAAYDTNGSGNLDSDEEIAAAINGGAATDIGVIKSFVCPAIHSPGS
jgi:hypothetical protein